MDCAEGNTLVPTWTYRGFFFQTCLLLLFRLILFNKFFPTYLFAEQGEMNVPLGCDFRSSRRLAALAVVAFRLL